MQRLPPLVGKQDSETFLSKAPHSWLLRQKHQGVRVLGKKSQKYKQVQNLQVPGDCSASPREGKGGGNPHYRHFGNKGGVEKGKVRPTGSGSAKAAEEKDTIKRPKLIFFKSKKKSKYKKKNKKNPRREIRRSLNAQMRRNEPPPQGPRGRGGG